MILIGSRALALRAPCLLTRQPKDFDFIATRAEADAWIAWNRSKLKPTEVYTEQGGKKLIVKGASICEFELIHEGSSRCVGSVSCVFAGCGVVAYRVWQVSVGGV